MGPFQPQQAVDTNLWLPVAAPRQTTSPTISRVEEAATAALRAASPYTDLNLEALLTMDELLLCPQQRPSCSESPAALDEPSHHSSSSHVIKRGEERKHKCSTCKKAYIRASHLRVHQRRHTRTFSFECTWPGCLRRFIGSDELTRHYRGHTGEKPYSCGVCSKAFGRSDHALSHLRSHAGDLGKNLDSEYHKSSTGVYNFA